MWTAYEQALHRQAAQTAAATVAAYNASGGKVGWPRAAKLRQQKNLRAAQAAARAAMTGPSMQLSGGHGGHGGGHGGHGHGGGWGGGGWWGGPGYWGDTLVVEAPMDYCDPLTDPNCQLIGVPSPMSGIGDTESSLPLIFTGGLLLAVGMLGGLAGYAYSKKTSGFATGALIAAGGTFAYQQWYGTRNQSGKKVDKSKPPQQRLTGVRVAPRNRFTGIRV